MLTKHFYSGAVLVGHLDPNTTNCGPPQLSLDFRTSDNGYQLVMFSNQGGIRSAVNGKTASRVKGLIDWLAREIDRPIHAVISTNTKSGFHKPNSQMWDICEHVCNKGVQFQPPFSIYVGDSDGNNTGDVHQEQGVDKLFAENVGKSRRSILEFQTPQAFFGESDSARRKANVSLGLLQYDPPPAQALQERVALLGGYLRGPLLLILCGTQGSGKSTFCQKLLLLDGRKGHWVHLSQDIICNGKPGTREAVERAARTALAQNKSVVIDRMHLNPEQRAHFIDLARAANVPAHVIRFNPPKLELAERVRGRRNHSGGVQGERGAKLALLSLENMVPPEYSEGLALITSVSTMDAADDICAAYGRIFLQTATNLASLPPLVSLPQHFNLHSELGDKEVFPSVVIGTQQIRKQVVASVVRLAAESGILAVDTSPMYNNEEQVGNSLLEQDPGYFVTVKVPKRAIRPAQVRDEFLESLRKLKRDSVELVLLHWPCDLIEAGSLENVWNELEQLKHQGTIRYLGVSNFSVGALRILLPFCKSSRPIVNQVERHLRLPQLELMDFCINNGILLQAHTPLGQGRKDLLEHPELIRVTEKSALTPAQIVLKWNLQQGVSVVPKCSSESHLRELVEVRSGPSLTPVQMKVLDGIGRKEAEQIRFVAPPFMYKGRASYSWGDRMPPKLGNV